MTTTRTLHHVSALLGIFGAALFLVTAVLWTRTPPVDTTNVALFFAFGAFAWVGSYLILKNNEQPGSLLNLVIGIAGLALGPIGLAVAQTAGIVAVLSGVLGLTRKLG